MRSLSASAETGAETETLRSWLGDGRFLTRPDVRRTFVRTYGKVPADWSFAPVRTERLELRVDEDLLQRIDDWMEQTGRASSRSDALRQLVDIGLGTMTGRTVHLSAGDKLNFMLLRDIAKHLKVPTETDVDLMAEVIYGGHYWAPAWEMQGLFHNHADRPADVSLVVNVLDMWASLRNGSKSSNLVTWRK